MHIDWTQFTPWPSLAGGLLLGLAAAALMLGAGRVLGISGMLGGLLRPGTPDRAWRGAFLLGLIAAPLAYMVVAPLPVPRMDTGWPVLVLAGLLVGWGTRRASGCTSGHGVCGLSSLSVRSLVATLCFMGAGMGTVLVVRHVLG